MERSNYMPGNEANGHFLHEVEPREPAGSRVIIETENGNLIGNLVPPVSDQGYSPSVLIMHGAANGFNPLPYFTELQTILADAGFTSLAFNTRGVGDDFERSDKNYNDQSIESRVVDAVHALDYLRDRGKSDANKIALITGSLGGHVGAKVTQFADLSALVLYEPSAYPLSAEEANLGRDFSNIIRDPHKDLTMSPVFDYLRDFNGQLFVAYGDSDTTVPLEVQEIYRELIKTSENWLLLPNTSHTLLANPRLGVIDPTVRSQMYDKTVSFLKRTL